MSDDDGGEYRMYGRLGQMELTVKGPDEEWVEERFEQSWANRLEEANEMKEAIRQADRSAQ
jgi:hypothetical protein